MDVTELPVSQRVDDLPERVAAALPEAMVSRLAALAELGHQLALAEKERDEALSAAHRYETASIRLSVDNRALRERLEALTRANHARSLRVWLGSVVRRAGWSR